ncbi:MAG: aldo/keto reductase [Anaerolineales bacterium]|jgi:aryl-alcohol dehydrogenase-like predicted oxidoreductase
MNEPNTPNIKIIPLGKTEIQISPLGTGTWQWGDSKYWGYGSTYQEADVQEAFQASLKAGVSFFDTAERYGHGKSEKLLGKFIHASSQTVVVATKYKPFPWRIWKKSLINALHHSLKRLNMPVVDLYQIHWPTPPLSIGSMADALADAVEAGLARAVGVCNYTEEQIRLTHQVLSNRGVLLASNQVNYSLLNRNVEKNGLLKACQELGITLIAYSPIAKGVLTGKYIPEKVPPGIRGVFYDKERLAQVQPLIRVMRETGQEHDGKSPVQVALNWLMYKGAVPIPGAKNADQAQENAGALGWSLTDEEVATLDEASSPGRVGY